MSISDQMDSERMPSEISASSPGTAEESSLSHKTDQEAIKTTDGRDLDEAIAEAKQFTAPTQHHSLKHHLLGPSLTKAGQNGVDQKKVAEVIYEASKGSKYFNNEEVKDRNLTSKIDRIIELKRQLEQLDLKHDLRRADAYITELELVRDLSNYVIHMDCDAFYAAVEEIDRPELKTVPMAVGVGVLTTCNYEARKYGCRSAMAGFVAKKLCPQLICLPLNFDKYTAKAQEVRAILAEYDPQFESSSIDEAYLNITSYCKANDLDPETAVTQLRAEIRETCKITVSAGIAPNAKIAKICSNRNKPDGQFRVENDRAAVMAFMRDLPVRKVNGIGRVLERELSAIGVKTCGDLFEQRAYLNRLFGTKTSQFLLQTYLGLGRTDVRPADDHERKTVGTESTFRDISSKADLRAKLRHTAEELEKDLKRVGVKGRTLCLKIKLHTYEVFTRQVVPTKAICVADDLYAWSVPLLAKLEREMPDMKIRLMGLRCAHLVSTQKPDVERFFAGRHRTPEQPAQESAQPEWETWTEEKFEEDARAEREEEFLALTRLSQEQQDQHESANSRTDYDNIRTVIAGEDVDPSTREKQAPDFSSAEWHEPFGHYKYGSLPANEEERLPVDEEVARLATWDCPCCGFAQPANDRDFNSHLDLCLSKEMIRDVVTEEAQPPRKASPVKVAPTKRRSNTTEPNKQFKQRKLFFS